MKNQKKTKLNSKWFHHITFLFITLQINFNDLSLVYHLHSSKFGFFIIWVWRKTRTKVVHKNVSQGCNLIKRFEYFKIAQTLHTIKVATWNLALISYLILICVWTSKEQIGNLPPSLLVGIGLTSAHTMWGSIRGRVDFTLELFELNKENIKGLIWPYMTFEVILYFIK